MLEGIVLLVFIGAIGYVILWSIQNDDINKEIKLDDDVEEAEDSQTSDSGQSTFKDRVK